LQRQISMSLEESDEADHLTGALDITFEQDLPKSVERKMKKIYQQRSES